MERVVIGVDPAKRSHAIEVIDEHEKSINDGWFAFDMVGNRGFIDVPASRHDRRFPLAFADGQAVAVAVAALLSLPPAG